MRHMSVCSSTSNTGCISQSRSSSSAGERPKSRVHPEPGITWEGGRDEECPEQSVVVPGGEGRWYREACKYARKATGIQEDLIPTTGLNFHETADIFCFPNRQARAEQYYVVRDAASKYRASLQWLEVSESPSVVFLRHIHFFSPQLIQLYS